MKKLLSAFIAFAVLLTSGISCAYAEGVDIPTDGDALQQFLNGLDDDDYDGNDDVDDDNAEEEDDDTEEEGEDYDDNDSSSVYASYNDGRLIGTVQDDGSILFVTQEDAHANANALKDLLDSDEKKTIVLPKERIEIDQTLVVCSNTTIIAEGATIYETEDKAILLHECDDVDYNSINDVTIRGGKWLVDKIEKRQKYVNTSIRFMHGSNITIDGVTVNTNYNSHALELIACEDVVVKNSKFLAIGKTTKKSNEEAVQIDIATPATAPYAAKFGAEFVKGQTCRNITVKNCEIRGSRGISTNKCDVDEKGKYTNKYLNKFHENITIEGCKIKGMTSEAMALHNALNVTVSKCEVSSMDKRYGQTYSIGINIASFGNHSKKGQSKIKVTGNKVTAGRQGIYIGSYTDDKRFGSAIIDKNKVTTKFKHTKAQLRRKKHPDFCAIYAADTGKVEIRRNTTKTKQGKKNAIYTKNCGKVIKKNNKANKG